jgi:hypothetical protein
MGSHYSWATRGSRIAPSIVYEDLAALGYEAAFTVST